MTEIIALYQRLLDQIENEKEKAAQCFQGDILDKYLDILAEEHRKVENNINRLRRKLL